MTKVFQDKFGRGEGNCMQAAVASLFDMELHEVPHFLLMKEDWFQAMWEVAKSRGYTYSHMLNNPKRLGAWGKDRFEELQEEEGVNGYFYAAVYSPKLFCPQELCSDDPSVIAATHAVIIDKDCNIVHDPHPEYQHIKQYPLHTHLGYNGVVYTYVFKKIINPL